MWRCAVLLALSGLLAAPAGVVRSQQKGGKDGGGPPPAPVVVSRVKAVREAPNAEYTGLIEPAQKARLASEVAGRVIRLYKKAGDLVREGETMAVLENQTLVRELAVMQARLKQSEAELALDRQQQQRLEDLYQKDLISKQEYEDGQAALEVTRAKLRADRVQVEQLRDQLQHLVIRSPLAGQVISAELELGQWITPNTPIFRIYNYDRFEVRVGVPSRFMPEVRSSGKVRVTVPDIGRTVRGEIVGVVRHVDQRTGNFFLRIGVPNPERRPLSGMLARVRLPLGPTRVRLAVPRDAIVRRAAGTHVVTVVDGRARVVPVQVQGNRGDSVIVQAEGLQPDAPVVVRGNERLFPGTPVKVAQDFPTSG